MYTEASIIYFQSTKNNDCRAKDDTGSQMWCHACLTKFCQNIGGQNSA